MITSPGSKEEILAFNTTIFFAACGHNSYKWDKLNVDLLHVYILEASQMVAEIIEVTDNTGAVSGLGSI